MKRRRKTILLVTVLILIPVLFALTPLNFVQKLGSGAPFSPVKQALRCNPCPFHSLASHFEPAQVDVNWVLYEPLPTVFLTFATTGRDVIRSGFMSDLPPLRC